MMIVMVMMTHYYHVDFVATATAVAFVNVADGCLSIATLILKHDKIRLFH